MKHCNGCNKDKELDQFYSYFSKERNKIRICSKCKECNIKSSNARFKKRYSENKDEVKLYNKNYRIKNKDRINELKRGIKKKAISELKNYYVNEQIARVLNVKLSDYSIPAELTEAYRLNIKIKRRWQEIK